MEKISLSIANDVATISLNKAPGNLLDIPFMSALAKQFKSLRHPSGGHSPRAIFLKSGVEGQFCQGIDPQAILATDVPGRLKVFLGLADLVEAIWFCGIPVLADINGPALAGGAVLASLADFAVIDKQHGKIAFSEAKVGLPLPSFVQDIVRSKTNPAGWNDVMLLGKNVEAEEAFRLGFVNAVYQDAEGREHAVQSYLSKITRLPPAVLSETLRGAKDRYKESMSEFRVNSDRFRFFLSDDYLGKGLKALVSGKAPQF